MGTVDLSYMQPPAYSSDTDGETVVTFACCIRWEPNPDSTQGRSRPYLYVNAAHSCRGITGVRVDYGSGRLIISPAESWSPLQSVHLQPDETFTANGITAGPSMSSTASVQLARAGVPMRADDPLLASLSLGNLWFSAVSRKPATTA